MKIISVHKGFACDHSSTSYEFLAVDKPLDEEAREEVASRSSRACPTSRRVSFIYHAEGYDIPGGWRDLMRQYYDVMYSESYDWWTFAMAFDAPKEQQEALVQYAFSGADELGVSVLCDDDRVTVAVNCRADSGALCASREEEYGGHWYDYEEEDEEDEEDEELDDATVESGNELLDLLTRVRQQLIEGDYRTLYAVWEVYGRADDAEPEEETEEEEAPPRPPRREEGQDVVEEFQALLAVE